jgi:hypothetical protein
MQAFGVWRDNLNSQNGITDYAEHHERGEKRDDFDFQFGNGERHRRNGEEERGAPGAS